MAGVSFRNKAVTALDEALLSTQTTMKIMGGDWWPFTRTIGFYCMLLGADRSEIVRVTGGTSPYFTIERGQEGTSAKDWTRGTLCYQDVTATTLSGFRQSEAFRQGAYNPNGALSSLYFGEKFYQTDDELWWKSIAEGSTEWRLIAGEIFIDDVEFSPNPGTYNQGQALTMEVLAAGADIYYTDDGSTPDENSTEYTDPIVMPLGTRTYKARAYGSNRWETPGGITSGSYTIEEARLWQNMGANVGTNVQSMITYGGYLYAFTYSRKLYEYNGDGSPGWTLRADTPGDGSVMFLPSQQLTATSGYIFASDTAGLLRWETGDGSWTRIAKPSSGNFGGAVRYDNSTLFCHCKFGTSVANFYSFNTGTSVFTYQGEFYDPTAGIDGATNSFDGKAYLYTFPGLIAGYSPYTELDYGAHSGYAVSAACATDSLLYCSKTNGGLHAWDATNDPYDIITDPFPLNGKCVGLFWGGGFNDNYGVLYALSGRNTYANNLYGYYIGGADEWFVITLPPNDMGTNYFNAATTYNNTIYACTMQGGITYKYTGT